MASAEEARGTADRGTSGRGRGRVDFVSLRNRGVPVEVLARVLPRETIVLDEVRITPSEQWRNRETVGRAKHVVAQAESGRRVADRDIERLQQRLLSIERQAQLAGRESEGRPLAEALGEVRQSQLVGTALDLIAQAKKGRRLDERRVAQVQQRLLDMGRQGQLAGRESDGMQLAASLGEVRRAQVTTDAKAVLARAASGGRVDDRQIQATQQRLLAMERQDELLGNESEGRQLARALSDVKRSQLVADAKGVLAGVSQGRLPSGVRLARLQRALVEMERQDQLEGRESEGLRLALELAEARR